MDIAFLVDTSAAVSDLNFKREKNFLKTLIRSFTISSNLSRVSLISYGNETDLTVSFSDRQTTDSLIGRVDSLPFLGGRTQINQALEMAAAQFARDAVSRTVVIVTDCRCRKGLMEDSSRLNETVALLRRNDVRILVVAAGCDGDEKGLDTLVEDENDIFTADSFEGLAAAAARVSAAASQIAGTVEPCENDLLFYLQFHSLCCFM